MKRIWHWLTGIVTFRARRIEMLALFALLLVNQSLIRPWVLRYERQGAGAIGIAIVLLGAAVVVIGARAWHRGRGRTR